MTSFFDSSCSGVRSINTVLISSMSSPVQLDNLSDLLVKSEEFGKLNSYGCSTSLCRHLLEKGEKEELLLDNANSSYPLLHHSVLRLAVRFLKLKQRHGSSIEKGIYRNMTIEAFIDRLLR